MYERAPQNGCFFIRFVMFTSTLVGWVIILPPGIGWDTMWCESEPFPSYPKLRNCSYSVNLSTPLPHIFLRFIYRVLIPPAHHPDRPQHPLRLPSHRIDGTAGHPLCYFRLTPLDVHYDGVEPCIVHCLIYHWVIPPSTSPALCHHPRDPSRRLTMEHHQDLENIPGNHPYFAAI